MVEETRNKSKVWHAIRPEDRMNWDLVVFLVIVIATFEIPYNLLVGYKNETAMHAFNLLFYLVFGLDMVLNAMTMRPKNYDGFWGWRRLVGWIYLPWGASAYKHRVNPKDKDIWLETQPSMALGYLSSFWFVIDFLAVFPFELTMTNLSFLGMSRALRLIRLPRLMRMFRAVRAIKAFKAYKTVEHAFKLNPATGRFILISVTVPWMMHIIACLIYFFEADASGAGITSYTAALDAVFGSFIANDDLGVVTYGGEVMEKIAIVLGFTFFGVFIGNFASYFENMDAEKLLYEEKKKEWEGLFKEYPMVFTKNLKKDILKHELYMQSQLFSANIDEHARLIRSLDAELEQKIYRRMKNQLNEHKSYKLQQLWESLQLREKDKND